jgi:hypothetical protein
VPLCAVAAALSFSGCSTTPVDPTKDWSPNKIHSEAIDERNAGNYEKAIGLYEKLEGRAAGTPLAQQAQLERPTRSTSLASRPRRWPPLSVSCACTRPVLPWTMRCTSRAW